jgi:signal transduction histidine kinase
MEFAAQFSEQHRDLLLEVSLLVSERRGIDEIFAAFAGHIRHGATFDFTSLYVVTADPNLIRTVGNFPPFPGASKPGSIVTTASTGYDRIALERDGAEYRPDHVDVEATRVLVAEGYNRCWTTPLFVDGENYGMLSVAKKARGRFEDDQVRFLKAAAVLLATAVRQDLELERARRHAARASAASELVLALQAGKPIDDIFRRLPGLLEDCLEVDYVGLVVDQGAGFITAAEAPGQVFRGLPPDAAGAAILRGIAEGRDFVQVRVDPADHFQEQLAAAGFRRTGLAFLRDGGELRGLVLLARRTSRRFDSDELTFIELLRSVLAQSLANLREVQQKRLQASRSRVLSELALIVNDGQPIATHFARVCQLLAGEGYEFCALTARTPDRQGYQLMRSEPLPGDDGLPHPERMAQLRDSGAHSVQYGDETNHRGLPAGFFETGVRRAATVLISAGPSDEGLLTVGRRLAEPFTAEEMTFFELVGTLLAYAIANEGRVAASEAEAEEQAIIAEAAAAVARESSPLAITRALRGAVSRFIPAPYVSFGFLEEGMVEFVTREGPLRPMNVGEHFTRAFTSGQAVVPATASRLRAGESLPEVERIGVQAHLLTTAYSAGAVVGLLLIGSREESFVPGEREARFCRLIADIVGPAMANARAAQRQRWEAEDQRILAEVGAVAAREGLPQDILKGLRSPLASMISQPIALFGFREADCIVIPQADGSLARVSLGEYAAMLEEEGQIHGAEVPEDLALAGLGPLRLHALCATAVRSAGATVGYLILGSRDESFVFDERALGQCRRIAQVVGPAMENARAALRARLDAEEQSILAEAAAAVAAGRDERQIATALRHPIHRFLPEALVAVYFLHGDNLMDGTTDLGPFGPQTRQAIESGQVTVQRPWPPMSEMGLRLVDEAGMEQFVITALSAGGESRGVLFVGVKQGRPAIGERETRLLRLICDIAGPGFANARESARRAADAEEQRFLAETAAAAARATSERDLMHGLRAPFGRLIPQARIAFFFREADGLRLPGRSGPALPIPEQVWEVMELGQSSGSLRDPALHPASRAFFEPRGIHSWVDTTVATGGEPLGLFFVGTLDPDYLLTERDLRLCRLVADIVGPAMANIRESRRRQEDADEQRILAEAASAIAAGTSEQDILDRLVRPVRAFVPRARISFSYVENGEMWQYDGRNRRPVHQHIAKVLESGQETGELGVTEISDESYRLITSVGTVRWVDTLGHSGGSAIGLLWVGTPEAHEFTERDLRRLRLIADVTGPAMLNAREEARRREEAADERLLSEIASLAARANSGSEIIDALPDVLAPLVPGAFAAWGFIDGESIIYQPTPAQGAAGLTRELSFPLTPVTRAARETGQGVGSFLRVSSGHPAVALGLQHYVLTAYSSAGAPIGMLLLSTTDRDHRFSERALALFRRIAQVVGPAVETARAEAERARQAELYSLMLRSLSEGVVLSDIEGRLVFTNAMGRSILRALDPSEKARTWQDIIALLPEDTREGYRAVYERGEGSRGRTRLVVDGRDRWFDYELVPLTDPVMKILLVAADVTTDVEREQEQLRHREQMEQAQRLAALGELIGGVAHELNNPLTAILGFAEVMSLSPDARPLAEDLAVIQKEALRARNIVRDLLFIVRPGTSERSLIPVADLMGHIERLRRTAWTQQGIGWEINIHEPCAVWGNEHQLTQVMLNLVTNAEHALQGVENPRIAIRAMTRGGRTEIEVADTGAGMDEATRNRVFEPFFTTKQGHGTGLGLPLSYSIIQSHDGQIQVTSAPGRGTTFTISVPAFQETPAPATIERAPSAQGVIRVLVVDDEPSLRKVCQRLISSMGHVCDVAENSAAAIDLAQRNEFDVVLCDYRLASETANDVVAGFERVAPQLVQRVVIATGATTDAGVVELTERYGLKLIAKPYGAEDLAAVIQRAI